MADEFTATGVIKLPKKDWETRIAYIEKLKDFPKDKLDKIKRGFEKQWPTSSA